MLAQYCYWSENLSMNSTVQAVLKYESIHTDMDKDTACITASTKSFMCANNWHVTVYGTAYVFGSIYA